MSNPVNALQNFRSYVYNQVLIVCSNTTVAQELDRNSTISSFSTALRDKYQKINAPSGSYVVLINGATDAEFNITSAKWKNIFAPNEGTGNVETYTTISTQGTLNIVEPRGFRFLNVLNNALSAIGTDPNGAVFVLKTFFTGFTAQSTSSINNIKPFLFTIYKITSDIESSGADYTLSVAGISNGTTQQQYIANSGQKLQVSIPTNTTIHDAITLHLSKEINDRYGIFIQRLQDESGLGKDFDGRPIKYTFIVDELYNDPKYIVDQFPDYATHTGNNDPIITFGENPTIESALNKIMKHSSGVIRLDGDIGENVGGDNQKYTYKIHSTIRSTDDEYELVYVIRRYLISENRQGSTIVTPGNFIEFDYMYTGKNVDILELNINLNMGLTFFQTLATTSNFSDNKDDNPSLPDLTKGNTATQPTETGNPRQKTPIFFSTNVQDVVSRDVKDPTSMASFDALLARHSISESITNVVTIIGNPALLDNTTRSPDDIINNISTTLQSDVIRNNDTVTPLCKINIKMPRTYQRYEELESFWYQGFYRISSVEHSFDEDGSFTQKLNLVALVINN